MPQQTAIIPPPHRPWYRRLLASPRYLVLAVAGLLILGGAGAFAVSELGKEEAPRSDENQSGAAAPADEENGQDAGGAVAPGRVTVSVLNGTTVGGLAAELADRLQGQGFRLGNVTNSTDQQRAESVVLFSPGSEREAADVGRRLKIDQREQIDPESQTLAGDAAVVVIAGADLEK
jgi:hypothetical protein